MLRENIVAILILGDRLPLLQSSLIYPLMCLEAVGKNTIQHHVQVFFLISTEWHQSIEVLNIYPMIKCKIQDIFLSFEDPLLCFSVEKIELIGSRKIFLETRRKC